MEVAPYYDSVYDGISLYGISSSISGWIDVGVFLMDIQLLAVIIIGVIALFYLCNKIKRQFSQIEKDPKCEDCPVPDEQLINDNKK